MREVLEIKHHRRSLRSAAKFIDLRKRLSLDIPLVRSRAKKDQGAKSGFVNLARKYISINGSVLSEEGVGGTYFVQDFKQKLFAVFKPTDEEPGACNNPKKLLHNPPLPPGGGAVREVAAYLLDRNHASVPETYMIDGIMDKSLFHSGGTLTYKSGSLQKYVENIGDASTMGYSRFLVDDVHRIGILDIRLFNLDRSSENILVQKRNNQLRLIPIDHSYILPDKLSNAWFDWLYWPQAKVNFSEENLAYIARLNIEEDVQILRSLGFAEKNIQTLQITTLFLKSAAAAGLTLFEIAKSICRRQANERSLLEELVADTESDGKIHIEQFEKNLSKHFNRAPPRLQ